MIGSIQLIHLAQWVADLDAAGYAPATVHKAYQLFAAAMDAAVESGLIGRSPCRGVNLPRLETRATIRYLEPTEVNNLVGAIDSRYSAMVLAAAYTGLRFSELRADASSTSRSPSRKPHIAPFACQPFSSMPWPPTLRSTQMAPVSSLRLQAVGRSGGATSGAASGCQQWRHPSVNPARSTTGGIRMPRC